VVGGSIAARVEAALVGQLFSTTREKLHASALVRNALNQCEYVARARPSRNRWWRQEAPACLRVLSTLPGTAFDMATSPVGGVDCGLQNATRAARSGVLLLRGAVPRGILELEQARYWRARAEQRKSYSTVDSGRVYCGMLSDPSLFEPGLRETLKMLVKNQTASGLLLNRDRQAGASHLAPRIRSSEFIGMEQQLQDKACPSGECKLDWHMDGDFDPQQGLRSDKLWVMVHKDGGEAARRHSNIMVAPDDIMEQACNLAFDVVVAQGRHFGYHVANESNFSSKANEALERLSCTVEADPGDALILLSGVIHRTQDMKAGSRAALSVELF